MKISMTMTPEVMQAEWTLLRLSNLYARAMDRNEPELLDGIFTEDACLEGAWFKVAGRDKIRAMPSALHARYTSMMHAVHNQTVAINGDRAEGETYCVASHISTVADRGGPTIFQMGIRYDNDWVEQNGLWRFSRRHVSLLWSEIRAARTTVD